MAVDITIQKRIPAFQGLVLLVHFLFSITVLGHHIQIENLKKKIGRKGHWSPVYCNAK